MYANHINDLVPLTILHVVADSKFNPRDLSRTLFVSVKHFAVGCWKKLVYKPCPEYDKCNHQNKMKYAQCGVCLRAQSRAERPKVNSSSKSDIVGNQPATKVYDQPRSSSDQGRPCIKLDIPCRSCGHCNDVCEMSKCAKCDSGTSGRPEALSTIPCPSCGHSNEDQL